MRIRTTLVSASVIAASLFAGPIRAAEIPASKCITENTKAKHAAAMAQMKKDVAPYLNNPSMERVIATYNEGVITAWDAMEEPYCGYGAYGAASAIKSYMKTISRARGTFLANVKSLGAQKGTTTSTATIVKTVVLHATSPAVAGIKITGAIPSGLARGMRSEGVKRLQERLAVHYKLSSDELPNTGLFGKLTQDMVIKFQLEKKLIASRTSAGAGRVGPKTAAALNAIK